MLPHQLPSVNQFLTQFITEERLQLFNKVLSTRTRYLTAVLEDIFQTQNASAVIRSCECFGIQDVHIIENRNPFRLHSRITMGSTKWLTLNRYNQSENNTPEALRVLKEQGYRIVATLPDARTVSLDHFDLAAGKTALVFGSEKPGISSQVESLADEFLTIPMVGFTESLNISASAAILFQNLTTRLRLSGLNWQLTPTEKDEILFEWLTKHIRHSHLLVKRFLEDNKSIL